MLMNNATDPFVWRPDETFDGFSHLTIEKDGLLSGLRLAVKDLYHIKNVPTTAGNPDWLNTHEIPEVTSTVVETLITHGAELTGKTLTDELAYSLNGQNIHYGTPQNLRDPERLPGGSTSGSAVAVAECTADIGLGTDTGGSIRVPASYNGLFGIRPTHGVVSVDALVGLAPKFDTVGWITRDLITLNKVAKLLLADCHTPLSGAGVHFPELNKQAAHKDDITAFLSNADVKPDTSVLPQDFLSSASGSFRILQGCEIWREHGQWITSNTPTFAPDISERFKWCESLTKADEAKAQVTATAINKHVNALLDIYGVILLPTTPGPAPLLSTPASELAMYRNTLMSMTAVAGLGGLPQIHIPLKTTSGLAAGVSVIGKKYSDLALISLAGSLSGESV